MNTSATTAVVWEPPDADIWTLEAAHSTGLPPVTFRDRFERSFADGMRTSFSQLGLPLSHIELRHINGWPYTSVFLHNVPRKAGDPPPDFVLKLLTRVHPAFRRRTKIAATAIAERRPERFADDWNDQRSGWIDRILELQRRDIHALSDQDLADHVGAVGSLFGAAMQRHFELVAGSIPLGLWLARAAEWGLPPGEARSAVMHGTPVHDEARARLGRIAATTGGTTPDSLEALRAHSSEAASALDDYIEHHGWWATDDLIGSPRVVDHPEVIVGAVRATVGAASQPDPAELLASLRARVPADGRSEFDELAAQAQRSHRLLDDNSGILGSWVAGLAGHTLRATSERLASDGRLAAAEHLWGLHEDDVIALLRATDGLTPQAAAERYASWHEQSAFDPPPHLNGEPGPPPSPALFPAPIAHLMTGIGTFLEDKFNDAGQAVGVGTRTVTGRAVVAHSAPEAIERLQPGDILVTSATTPAYNSILPIVAGIVVSNGGPSCHAAVVARELDIPAIVGLAGATSTIPDGALVELDPVKGTARVVEPATD